MGKSDRQSNWRLDFALYGSSICADPDAENVWVERLREVERGRERDKEMEIKKVEQKKGKRNWDRERQMEIGKYWQKRKKDGERESDLNE